MAPEQAKGGTIDGRADLFSLGCVLYLMLTGKRPFKGNDTMSLLMSLAVETPTLPTELNREVPDAVSELTMRLLAKDAVDRPESAQAVADEITALSQGEPRPVRGRVKRPTAVPPRRRAPIILGIGAVLALLLLIGGVGGGFLIYQQVVIIRDKDGNKIAELKVPKDGKVEIIPDGKKVDTKTPPDVKTPAPLAKSPLDDLDPAKIAAEEREPSQPKELVAVLGTRHMVHWGWPHRMAFSPDGKLLATSPEIRGNQPLMDGIRLWDVATMRERAFLPGTGFIVAGFTSDGKTLITHDTHGGRKLQLWDVTGAEPKDRKATVPAIDNNNGLRWADQGNRLVFWTRDKVLMVWDVGSEFQKPRVIPATPNWDLPATISADGTRFAQAEGAKIRLWDLTAAEPKELPSIQTPFKKGIDRRSLFFTPDGTMLFAGESDLHRWDLSGPDAKPLKPLPTKGALALAMDRSGKKLAVGFDRFNRPGIVIHTLAGNEPPRVYADSGDFLYLAFSPDGNTLAINQSNGDCNVRLLDVTGPELKLRTSPQVVMNRLAFTPDGKMLLGQSNGQSLFWGLTGDLRRPPGTGKFSGLSMSISPDGKLLASGGNREFRIWNLDGGEPLPGGAMRTPNFDHCPLQFVPRGRTLACGYEDGKVQLWDLSGNQADPGVTFQGQTKRVRSLNFSDDGKCLACYSNEANSVQFWDLSGPEPKKDALLTAPGTIRSVALSPDGRTLASYVQGAPGDPHQCWLWDVGPGLTPKRRAVISYPGFDLAYEQMRFAPDGKSLVTLGRDGNHLKQFDAVTGKKLREWTFPGTVWTFAIASDSRHLALANSNGTTYILRLEAAPAGVSAPE